MSWFVCFLFFNFLAISGGVQEPLWWTRGTIGCWGLNLDETCTMQIYPLYYYSGPKIRGFFGLFGKMISSKMDERISSLHIAMLCWIKHCTCDQVYSKKKSVELLLLTVYWVVWTKKTISNQNMFYQTILSFKE